MSNNELFKWICLSLLKRLVIFEKTLSKINWKVVSEDLHTFIKTNSIMGYILKFPLCFWNTYFTEQFYTRFPKSVKYCTYFFHSSRNSAIVNVYQKNYWWLYMVTSLIWLCMMALISWEKQTNFLGLCVLFEKEEGK